MRVLAFALALLFAPCAAAQERVGVSGLTLGMMIEEARAVVPEMFVPANTNSFQTTYRTHAFGDMVIPLQLVFVDGVLDYIRGAQSYRVSNSEACLEYVRHVVEALEVSTGALDDRPDNSTAEGALPPVQTPGGSIMRLRDHGSGFSVAVTGYTPFVEVIGSSYISALTVACGVEFDINNYPPPPADLPTPTLANFEWAQRPDGHQFWRHYPTRAMDIGQSGMVILHCTVLADYALDCSAVYEGPEGWGFAEAALRIARSFRVLAQGPDSADTVGQTVRMPIRFRTAF